MTQFFSPGGADYADVTITLTFGPTISTQMAIVPIHDDNVAVNEDVGNTSVVVSLLSGSRLARDVIVSLQTLNITATGESPNELAISWLQSVAIL